jgi:hypothetical protein
MNQQPVKELPPVNRIFMGAIRLVGRNQLSNTRLR